MEGQEEPLSDTDATSSTDLELVALDNLQCSQPSSQPSASTSTAQSSRLQTYSSKQRRLQVTRCTKGTVEDTALFTSSTLLNNAITSFSSCAHQKLTDASLTILMTNMQGRILKEKLKDTNGMRQGRSCSIQRMTNLKIVSNLQFLVIHFYSYYMFIHSYKYYIMYAQEFLLNINYVCVHLGMLVYLYAVYAQELQCCCTVLFSQVCSSHY